MFWPRRILRIHTVTQRWLEESSGSKAFHPKVSWCPSCTPTTRRSVCFFLSFSGKCEQRGLCLPIPVVVSQSDSRDALVAGEIPESWFLYLILSQGDFPGSRYGARDLSKVAVLSTPVLRCLPTLPYRLSVSPLLCSGNVLRPLVCHTLIMEAS